MTPEPTHTAASPAPTTDELPTELDRKLLLVAGAIVLGVIMSALDMTVVNVAIPTFQETFHATYAAVAWAVTGYTLALATVIPITGWAADRFGTKRLYLIAIVLFVAGSVACSTASSLAMLVTFRVFQGFGGGMLMPLSMMILTRAAGPRRIGRMMALLGIPMLLGPICGPILGGYLIDAASWHWIFLINVPIGIAALAAGAAVLTPDRGHSTERFDLLGMVLLSPGLALFLYGVSSIPGEGTVASAKVLIPGAIGIVLMIAFVFHALGRPNALIDLSLFRDRSLTTSVITLVTFMIAFMGTMMLLPSFFMQVRGASTTTAGLLVAPQGLGAMISMPIGGRLVDKIGSRFVVLPGLVLIVIGLGAFTQAGVDTSYWYTSISLFIVGLGTGCTMMPLMTSALATLRDHQVARGSTLMSIVQQVGASIGAAVMSVVLTGQMLDRGIDMTASAGTHPVPPAVMDRILHAMAEAFQYTFAVSTVIVALTIIPALFLPRIRRGARASAVEPEATENLEMMAAVVD